MTESEGASEATLDGASDEKVGIVSSAWEARTVGFSEDFSVGSRDGVNDGSLLTGDSVAASKDSDIDGDSEGPSLPTSIDKISVGTAETPIVDTCDGMSLANIVGVPLGTFDIVDCEAAHDTLVQNVSTIISKW